MRKGLRITAILWAGLTLMVWLATGTHTGWTQTKVTVMKVDPITELQYPETHDQFVAGMDVVAGGLLLSFALFVGSYLFKPTKQPTTEEKQTMKILIPILSALAFSTAVQATPQSFDFKDPKGVNNAVFKLDAPLEAINGTASGISGTITYDPQQPDALSGTIVVDAKSLTVPNPMMLGHLHGEQWMDVEKFPRIAFESTRVSNVKTSGDKVTADVTGKMTIHGVTREMTVPVSFTYLKDRLGDRTMGQMQGDLLVVRSTFTIQRADFDINPKAPEDKVAEEIELTLSLAGAAPRMK